MNIVRIMDAGIAYAKTFNLRPGVALSAAQMAVLSSDIVWLVETEVTLADGSAQKVLVPRVYARVRDGDIDTRQRFQLAGIMLPGSINESWP